MSANVTILRPDGLNGKIKKIQIGGAERLQVISDFDRTLTYGSVNGVPTPSIIAMLRDGHHLTSDYAPKANALFDHYHPIEADLSIPLSERIKAMEDWWATHNQLLIDSGLTKADLEDIATKGSIEFREGALTLFEFLSRHDIPMVVMSASGSGDAIPLFFQHHNCNYSNMTYIINQFNYDELGNVISTKGQPIHSLNKNASHIVNDPMLSKRFSTRSNVIILGDSIGDLDMVKGFAYENLITIGFLNADYNKSRDAYLREFDVVIEGDGDINYVLNLIRRLTNGIVNK